MIAVCETAVTAMFELFKRGLNLYQELALATKYSEAELWHIP